jgi:hypothetical protein
MEMQPPDAGKANNQSLMYPKSIKAHEKVEETG